MVYFNSTGWECSCLKGTSRAVSSETTMKNGGGGGLRLGGGIRNGEEESKTGEEGKITGRWEIIWRRGKIEGRGVGLRGWGMIGERG